MRRRQALAKDPTHWSQISRHSRERSPMPDQTVSERVAVPKFGENDEFLGCVYRPMTDAEVSHAYEEKFGKPPHHRMKRETIVARLKNDAGHERA